MLADDRGAQIKGLIYQSFLVWYNDSMSEPLESDEFLNPTHKVEAMMNFMGLVGIGGVNNFILEGPATFDKPTDFNLFAGLFSPIQISGPPQIIMGGIDVEDPGMVSWHKRILGLTVPERVQKLKIKGDPEARKQLEAMMNSLGLPYAVIAFGQQVEGGVDMTLLYTVLGLQPEKALEEFQKKSKERLASIH